MSFEVDNRALVRSKEMNRWKDWWNQASKDLEHAKKSLQAGDLEWAAFAAQQGAEKAVKALILSLGGEAWGHSVFKLLHGLPPSHVPPEDVLEAGKRLDRHYIPSRYPNGFAEGYPSELYSREESEGAVRDAEKILEFCGSLLPGQEGENR